MHLLVILAIVLIIMGPSRLPEIGAGIGKGLKELKKALSNDDKNSAIEVKGREVRRGSSDNKM